MSRPSRATRPRPHWDFPYELPSPPPPEVREALDVVVATDGPVEAQVVAAQLREELGLPGDVAVECLLARAPLFWTRVRGPAPVSPSGVADVLARAGIAVRYVAEAHAGTMALAPALAFDPADRVRGPLSWPVRRARPVPSVAGSPGHWFLGGAGGVSVERRVCGSGAGTRLAVIDNEAADLDQLELESLTCVGIDEAPKTAGHAALMIAWATGARPRLADGANGETVRAHGDERFVGVAPDASARLYCIPKPGSDVVSLPVAIARAVFDGADVIVCATYLEGTACPMLDDALDVATHLGRRGRGTLVVLPTGREASSPRNSLHASLSLGLGDPASDPRAHCIAPGGRKGGWFLWRNAAGTVRPFSNRGPAVRWVAPGDDIVYPFSCKDRLFHAESSGASAVAAGVMLLVLACNPRLRSSQLHALLAGTADRPDPDVAPDGPLADAADVLPAGEDADGHDAKCGYGRLNARRACAAARDPFALELAAMGEDHLAAAWSTARRPYSRRLARWAVGALLGREDLRHALRVILRHARLIAAEPARAEAQARGALPRHLALAARELSRMRSPPSVREEARRLLARLERASSGAGTASPADPLEAEITRVFQELRAGDRLTTGSTGSTGSIEGPPPGPVSSATVRS